MRIFLKALALIISIFAVSGLAQDRQELEAERQASLKLKGEHPLIALGKSKPSSLKPDLAGVHPRVFLTQTELDKLKAKTVIQKELWQTALSRVRALTVEPPKPPADPRPGRMISFSSLPSRLYTYARVVTSFR